MNKNLKEKLIYSGLSPKQADIYIYLNSNGESTANNIAKSLGFDRTVVYNTLNRLIDMGFVSHSNKGNIKVFFASNPETITQKMKEKETILLEVVDELKKIQTKAPITNHVEIFEGKEGLKSLFEFYLKQKDSTIYSMGGTGKSYDLLTYTFKNFELRAVRNNIKLKVLNNFSSKDHIYNQSNIISSKYLPEGYENHATTTIMNDYVSIHILTEKPIIILIKNKEVADGYLNYFKILWNIAKTMK